MRWLRRGLSRQRRNERADHNTTQASEILSGLQVWRRLSPSISLDYGGMQSLDMP